MMMFILNYSIKSAGYPFGLPALPIPLQFPGFFPPHVILYPVFCIPHLISDYHNNPICDKSYTISGHKLGINEKKETN